MSKTLLNRLAMFEVLDASGQLTISELATRSGLDVTVVSRTVAACEPDGWVTRAGGRVLLGPRFALLGHSGPAAELITLATALVHAIAGVTGLLAQAYSLIGSGSVVVASATGRWPIGQSGLSTKAPLYAMAGGRAIAAGLPASQLDHLLPAQPYPDAAALIAGFTGTSSETMFAGSEAPMPETAVLLPRDRAELDAQLEIIRSDGFARDDGALTPAIHCIARSWPTPALPTALACLGSAEHIDSNRELIERVLIAATEPGATPTTVVAAASE